MTKCRRPDKQNQTTEIKIPSWYAIYSNTSAYTVTTSTTFTNCYVTYLSNSGHLSYYQLENKEPKKEPAILDKPIFPEIKYIEATERIKQEFTHQMKQKYPNIFKVKDITNA